MVLSNDNSIDKRIVEMRKNKFGLSRIHRWLSQWDNFNQLDEQIVLAHILGVLNDNNLLVTKGEVKYCFDQYYQKEYHGDKKSYLKWLYKEFNIQFEPQQKKKRTHSPLSKTKSLHIKEKTEQGGIFQ